MLYLRMLGGLSIHHATEQGSSSLSAADGALQAFTALTGAATQRRPLALLAYLATAGDRGRSRDDVLVHLWPDSTPARARNVLKQTVYALRRDLGEPDLVLADGDRLRLNPAVVANDVAEFEAALDRTEHERALALYRGPFLDGISLSGVPEFDRWAWLERERLAGRHTTARPVAQPEHQALHERVRSGADAEPTRHRVGARAFPRRLSRGAVAAFVALAAVGAFRLARRAHGAVPLTATDEQTIAILPFDIAAADTALEFLKKGMVDLLAIRLTGDGESSPRAIATGVVLRTLERASPSASIPSTSAAVQLAQDLHAGRVVQGSVLGTSAHLVLSAEMRASPSGKRLAQASVTGTADSLSMLVDRLAGMLLLGAATPNAEAEQAPRNALAGTPLTAVRDYVQGQTEYRAGRYDEAVRCFERALTRDSTFAQAALGLALSAGWAGAPEAIIQRGTRLAWRHRDRLSRRARLILSASVGGADVLKTGYASDTLLIGAAERAAEANPDDAEMWYWLGDRYLHLGPAMGLAAPDERAAAAFRRAIEVDPTFIPPFIHLVQLAARSGDTTTVRRTATQLLQRDSTSESARFIQWRMAIALADSATLRNVRSHFDEMPAGALRLILMTAECDAVGLDDADRAIATLLRRSTTRGERMITLIHAHAYALNRGQWQDALRATEAIAGDDPVPRWHLRIRVLDALYAGGDSIAARAAVDTLRRFADAALSSDARARSAQYEDIAVVTQWELWHGDRHGLPRAVARLSAGGLSGDSLRRQVANHIDAALLHAVAANTGGSRDVASVDSLDRLLAMNVVAPLEWPGLYSALAAARLFAVNGQPRRALTAVRRRMSYFPENTYLAAALDMEASVDMQLGNTADAGIVRHALAVLRGPSRGRIAF
jgi:tetratricopeptide (TPR) repeat protein